MSNISIQNLEKKYGDHSVLKGICLDIDEGEFVTLIGPSGCGKSTLLKIIAGLEDASGGAILIGDRDMTSVPPQKRNLAMVFQNYALYPQMSVRKNLSFGLKISGMSKDEINRRTEAIAKTLEISDYLDRKPRQLSGGQRQRVAMGRAMVREPGAFLLDEPLSNLDAALRNAMRSEIKALHKRLGRTMVYVTHDQIEAMTMADRIAIMRAGEIIQFGAPDDLYLRPVNTFVASFFGTPKINLWDGVVEQADGGRMDVRIGANAVVSLPEVKGLKSRSVTVGVRPEALNFATTGIPVTIDLVEPTGSQTEVLVSFGEQVRGALLVQGRYQHDAGKAVFVDRAIDDVHLFESATGERIN
ncbi:ABC transporter ATP-binding protein [Pelagibius litoralis]|uniref:ABC transporter ATP-binding protein n=1 Tax=Pelagibius litoralis TaxID=374515 RepID=A0A967KFL3_9PROT|nr:ABC transporter ATP-binding protein [Pelagibius litoralis]NIA69661.1 ABC transporter ATP-binding protein [Pelagibius litoralis]